MKLPVGKIPVELLDKIVFKNLGVSRKEVVVGPKTGVDGAVIKIGDKNIIVSMDPVTGANEKIGWLAVNVNANDVATFGVEPAFMFSCMLLPANSDSKLIEKISSQINKAATNIGVSIVGGHCESTLGLNNPVVVGCIIGFTDNQNYITAANAKPRDKIILTKSAGIEGTAILASDKEKTLKKKLSIKQIENAKNFYKEISVVREALIAYKTGGVNAMHDPTEGGIIGGILEMADASKLGVKIYKDKISVRTETALICKLFKIDPLRLISSGALLISTNPKYSEKILKRLSEEGIQAAIIGEFLPNSNQRIINLENNEEMNLTRTKSDHLWKALQS